MKRDVSKPTGIYNLKLRDRSAELVEVHFNLSSILINQNTRSDIKVLINNNIKLNFRIYRI